MLALPLFLIICAWYFVLCVKWKKNIFDVMEKMPGARWLPILGTFYPLSTASHEDVIYRFIGVAQKYAPFFRSWNGGVHEVHVMKAEHAQILLRSSSYTAKGPFYNGFIDWFGAKSIFLTDGPIWFLKRKLLTPHFHFKILEGFVQTFGEKATELTEVLSTKADGSYFDVLPSLHPITLSAICETSFGVPLERIEKNPLAIAQDIHDMLELIMWRYWQPWVKDAFFYLLPQGRRYRRITKRMHEFSRKILAYRRQHRENRAVANGPNCDNSKGDRLSFLDLVLDANESQVLNDDDVYDIVNTFIFAGLETTANTLGWILFALGNNPHVQEKAYEEIVRVLKDKEVPTTMEEVNELRYIDCIVKETLRVFPILPFLTRGLKEDIEIDGQKIPSGTQVIVHIADIQRDPDYYSEPNEFKPERFFPENSKNRHPFAFLPFSAGPRNCLGMRFALIELRILVASLIKRFKVASLDTPDKLKIYVDVLMSPQTGMNIKLEKREELVN